MAKFKIENNSIEVPGEGRTHLVVTFQTDDASVTSMSQRWECQSEDRDEVLRQLQEVANEWEKNVLAPEKQIPEIETGKFINFEK